MLLFQLIPLTPSLPLLQCCGKQSPLTTHSLTWVPGPSVSCSQTIHRIFSLSSFSSSSLPIPPHLTWLASSILLRFQIIYNPHKSTYFPHPQLCECVCERDRCVCMCVYECVYVSECVDQVTRTPCPLTGGFPSCHT